MAVAHAAFSRAKDREACAGERPTPDAELSLASSPGSQIRTVSHVRRRVAGGTLAP